MSADHVARDDRGHDRARQAALNSPRPATRRGGSIQPLVLLQMASEEVTGPDALSLLIDLESRQVKPMAELSLAAAGLRERDDLQRWVTDHPELIASGLLLVTTEFDRWEIRDHKVADRLDALFLDDTGSPVVVEFKRDRAADTVELQALKYAAYCAQLTMDELAEEFAATHECSSDDAQQKLRDHAPSLEDGALSSVKILLVQVASDQRSPRSSCGSAKTGSTLGAWR